MSSRHVQHRLAGGNEKAQVAERAIAKIRAQLAKLSTFLGTKDWSANWREALSAANKTPHSRYGIAPGSVDSSLAGTVFLRRYKKHYLNPETHRPLDEQSILFPVGSPVRILVKKSSAFGKGSAPKFSAEVFFVQSVRSTHPVTYLLKDSENEPIIEAFHDYELSHAEPGFEKHKRVRKVHKRKAKQVQVSFERIPIRMKQWLDQSELKTYKGPMY